MKSETPVPVTVIQPVERRLQLLEEQVRVLAWLLAETKYAMGRKALHAEPFG